jgi:hypothetical protein
VPTKHTQYNQWVTLKHLLNPDNKPDSTMMMACVLLWRLKFRLGETSEGFDRTFKDKTEENGWNLETLIRGEPGQPTMDAEFASLEVQVTQLKESTEKIQTDFIAFQKETIPQDTTGIEKLLQLTQNLQADLITIHRLAVDAQMKATAHRANPAALRELI